MANLQHHDGLGSEEDDGNSPLEIDNPSNSIPLFRELKGGRQYRRDLRDATTELYHLLRENPAVSQAAGAAVVRRGRKVGRLSALGGRAFQLQLNALEYLLHSLAYVASHPMRSAGQRLDCVALPMSTGNFVSGMGYSHLSREPFRQMVLALLVYRDDGKKLIDYASSVHSKDQGRSLRTRIAPTGALCDWMMSKGLIFPYHPHGYDTRHDCLGLLRLKHSDDSVWPLERSLDEDEAVLPLLNERLKKQSVKCRLGSYAEYQRYYNFKDGRPPVLSGHKSLYRQFQLADGSGGRLYGHWVQRMPAKLRHHLEIDRKPTVELDFANMQLRLLYAVQSVPLPDCDDLYGVEGFSREDMKVVATRTIGSASREAAIGSIANNLRENNRLRTGKAEALFDAFWSYHEAVEPFPNGGAAWPVVQNLESRIILHGLARLLDKGIAAIPIHDSMVVQEQHEEATRDAMLTSFRQLCPNVEPVVQRG